jgi:hypothetical protein
MQRNGQKPTPKKQARDRIRARESVRRSVARATVRAKRQNPARRHSAAMASLASEQTGGLRAQTGALRDSAAMARLAIETKCVTDDASRCVVYAPSLTGASSKSPILQCATDGAPIATKRIMETKTKNGDEASGANDTASRDTRGTYYGGVNSEPCGTCGPCKHYDFRGCWSPVRKDGK